MSGKDGKIDKPTSNVSSKMAGAGNPLSNADWGGPYKLWKGVTINPAGSALASAALAGGAAYLSAPLVAKLFGKMNKNLPKFMQHQVSTREVDEFRKRLTWIAALGAGGLSVLSNVDLKEPVKSMMDWDYHRKKASEEDELSKENVIRKMASFGLTANKAIMAMDIIPLDHAKEIVANDPYLNSSQKAAIGTIFDRTGSDTETGNTSMADLTAGAVRAGLGFAGGAIAGYALGKIFSLPASVTRTASMTGGLANALRSSGLIT
jgi:hypothetical protein